ncbi:MAG: metal ABC transporter permease [Phycisphaeraceae bacterium]|nr:metal ABC transporter permease [Phycisphaeraceae bacterium]
MIQWVHELDTWIVIAAVLSSVACALVGCFLVLRRLSLMGDAISHAVLPGLAIGFLLTASRESLPMFIGAAVVGVLTAVFTQWLVRYGRVEESASMGAVFTILFALGLVMIEQSARHRHVELDARCVLFGAIEYIPLHLVQVGPWLVPSAVVWLTVVLAMNIAFVALFYKELKICAFDPALAQGQGIPSQFMHYALMAMVAITTVASFTSVGSILVIAMLVVPAATAHLLTDRFGWMLILSMLLAAAAGILGHVGALTIPSLLPADSPAFANVHDLSTSGMMAVCTGGMFVVAMLAAPRRGLISRALDRALLTLRICREDVLALLYRLEERAESGFEDHARLAYDVLRKSLGTSRVLTWLALRGLARRGLIRDEPDRGWRMTDAGRARAAQLLQSHRLWETYLNHHYGLIGPRQHSAAEKLEHITTQTMRGRLDDELSRPRLDPHGRTVPRPDGT